MLDKIKSTISTIIIYTLSGLLLVFSSLLTKGDSNEKD